MNNELYEDYYPKITDDDLQYKLYKKREFYGNKIIEQKNLSDYNDIKKFRDKECKGTNYRPQQEILSNLINPDTPYKGLLVYHGVGTGKTGGAISVAEKFIEQIIKYETKIHILVPGPFIKESWQTDIIKFTGHKYEKQLKDKSLDKQKKK